jgi:hypothetical protein
VERSRDYDDDDDYQRSSRSRGGNSRLGEGRGWFGDEEGHSDAAMEGWQHRRVEEAATMTMMTTIKDLRAVVAEEAVTMTMMMTTRDPRAAGAEEVVIMTKTKTIIKGLRAPAADAGAVTKKMTTIIKGLHGVAQGVRAVAKAEVGMVMRKVTQKQQWKAGSIGVEEETAAAMTMMTMTIIKDLLVVAAEVRTVAKAEDGLVMKEDIPGRPGKAGEIATSLLDWNFEKVRYCKLLNVPFLRIFMKNLSLEL